MPSRLASHAINVGADGAAMVNGDNSNSMGGYREASAAVLD